MNKEQLDYWEKRLQRAVDTTNLTDNTEYARAEGDAFYYEIWRETHTVDMFTHEVEE